jgi:hypothetical protein
MDEAAFELTAVNPLPVLETEESALLKDSSSTDRNETNQKGKQKAKNNQKNAKETKSIKNKKQKSKEDTNAGVFTTYMKSIPTEEQLNAVTVSKSIYMFYL